MFKTPISFNILGNHSIETGGIDYPSYVTIEDENGFLICINFCDMEIEDSDGSHILLSDIKKITDDDDVKIKDDSIKQFAIKKIQSISHLAQKIKHYHEFNV
jgi:hypothetical protein